MTDEADRHRSHSYRLEDLDSSAELGRLRAQVEQLAGPELELLRRLGILSAKRFVDVGCGPGFFAEKLRSAVDGAEVKLTRKEFDVLALLARHAGRLVTHKQLLTTVWGPAHGEDTHYLRIAIGHIRDKLGDDAADPEFVITEPGVGYRLTTPG